MQIVMSNLNSFFFYFSNAVLSFLVLLSCKALRHRLCKLTDKDILICYLPLAHVMELMCEITCLTNGLTIGYSSPLTLSDVSTGIKSGQLGDLRVLKPTMMAAVPIILERLSKAVKEKLGTANWIKQTLFRVSFQKKLKMLNSGYSTPLLNAIVFNKIRNAILGENLRMIMTGGAMLTKSVHEFSQVCFAQTYQGFFFSKLK